MNHKITDPNTGQVHTIHIGTASSRVSVSTSYGEGVEIECTDGFLTARIYDADDYVHSLNLRMENCTDYVAMLKEQGITFDYAVPQPWLDEVAKKLGRYIQGYVWVYIKGSMFGVPCPRNSLVECSLIAIDEPYWTPEDRPVNSKERISAMMQNGSTFEDAVYAVSTTEPEED